jgi:hypothetical protein
MRVRRLVPFQLVWFAATAAAAACVEKVVAPGKCPEFCPSGSLETVDTLLAANIVRDSAYRGYVFAHQASAMLVADAPGIVDSRAIFLTGVLLDRVVLGSDTTTSPIVASDSLKLALTITQRDTGAHDLTLRFYRLLPTLDSNTTFADVAAPFGSSALRTVNLDSLLAKVDSLDTASGDSIGVDSTTGDAIRVDTTKTNHRVAVTVKFDSLQAPYVAADSGKLGLGIRVSANGPTSLRIATIESGLTRANVTWYVTVDSISGVDTTPVHKPYPRGVTFDNYVSDPPAAPLDSTLAVGGVPSARSLLRVTLPRGIRDSAQIIRATLILVPAVPARGAPPDSFVIEAHTVLADFGAKSSIALDPTRVDTTTIRLGATSTIRIEVTNLLQFWAADTLRPTAVMLRAQDEGANPAEVRFYPSAAPSNAPSLQVTFVRRFPFGVP